MANHSTPYANFGWYVHWETEEADDDYPIDENKIHIMFRFGSNYIKRLFVIVETYDHKGYGRGKREYLKQFSKKERNIISHYYGKIYRWYLVKGIPHQGVVMKPETYALLCRAADFFATI